MPSLWDKYGEEANISFGALGAVCIHIKDVQLMFKKLMEFSDVF